MEVVNGLILATFATMAIPTMVSALYLAPNVNKAAKIYFSSLNK
jgi:AGCS family alanine or glycine:cation symporter